MPNKNDKSTLTTVNSDILSLANITSKIGWDSIRENSVFRILYLATVLYSFMHPDKQNPFSKVYHFDIDVTGPYSEEIKKSLVFLESNDYLTRYENKFKVNFDRSVNLASIETEREKEDWFKIIIHLLGLYGESKIYDFVIRDPQYQDYLERNVPKELNTTEDNETIKLLTRFRKSFEKALGDKANIIDDKEYLKLYFEYVFSKILKGEIEL